MSVKIGTVWSIDRGNVDIPIEKFILCIAKKENNKYFVTLISLSNGDRWVDPVEVKDRYNISINEAEKLFRFGKWRRG